MAVSGLLRRRAFGDAVNQLRNGQLAEKTILYADLPHLLAQVKLIFRPVNADVGIE